MARTVSVIGCAPPALREAPVSDRLPANTAEVVGAANEPNGWRGGTEKLELLHRDVISRQICLFEIAQNESLGFYDQLTYSSSFKSQHL